MLRCHIMLPFSILSYEIVWYDALVHTVNHAHNEVPETGDFASLSAEFVISVKFTACNKVKRNENIFAVSIN